MRRKKEEKETLDSRIECTQLDAQYAKWGPASGDTVPDNESFVFCSTLIHRTSFIYSFSKAGDNLQDSLRKYCQLNLNSIGHQVPLSKRQTVLIDKKSLEAIIVLAISLITTSDLLTLALTEYAFQLPPKQGAINQNWEKQMISQTLANLNSTPNYCQS